PAGSDALSTARLVVLPAWIEDQPRRLLRAIAAGIPVIASDACGLEGVAGVTTVPVGDVLALRNAVIDAIQG
ncbi:MAG TPA: glycosyltransferase, partial [Verrucomicrobiae bacterium]|nr:glycosyltransferase [Verrucomicrobiae bacterium]